MGNRLKRIRLFLLMVLLTLAVGGAVLAVACGSPTPPPKFSAIDVEARVERYVSGLRCAPPYSRSCRGMRDITTVATYQGKGMWEVSLRGVMGVSTAKLISTPTPNPMLESARQKLERRGVVGTSAVKQTPIPVEVASSWHFWEESRVITPADEIARLIVVATLVYDVATLESRIDEMDYLVARLREKVGTPNTSWNFTRDDDLFSRTRELDYLIGDLSSETLESRVSALEDAISDLR